MKLFTYIVLVYAIVQRFSAELYAGIVPTEGTFEGFYHRDRWGDGEFAGFIVSSNLFTELKSVEGQFARIHVRKAMQHINPGPATLYEIWTIERLEVYQTIRVTVQIDPPAPKARTPFKIQVEFKNVGKEPIRFASGCAYVRVTAQAANPLEVYECWEHLWANYSRYPSHAGVTLISTRGFLTRKGATNVPTDSPMLDVPLARESTFVLTLPFEKGLPEGKYEIKTSSNLRMDGGNGLSVPNENWTAFAIE